MIHCKTWGNGIGADSRRIALIGLFFFAGCNGGYPMHWDLVDAALHGDTKDVKRHLHYDDSGIDGWTGATSSVAPLHMAAAGGHLDTVKVLVKAGARLKVWGPGGVFPIHLATIEGHLDIVKYFLAQGMDIDVSGGDGNPLHYAIRHGHSEIFRFLLDRGADIQADPFNAPSPLHVASETGRTAMAKALVEHGADLHARDTWGRTPRERALRYEQDDVVELLGALSKEKTIRAD